jgi:hypothetical protein
MPSKRYKVVNPYAICHKMKRDTAGQRTPNGSGVSIR